MKFTLNSHKRITVDKEIRVGDVLNLGPLRDALGDIKNMTVINVGDGYLDLAHPDRMRMYKLYIIADMPSESELVDAIDSKIVFRIRTWYIKRLNPSTGTYTKVRVSKDGGSYIYVESATTDCGVVKDYEPDIDDVIVADIHPVTRMDAVGSDVFAEDVEMRVVVSLPNGEHHCEQIVLVCEYGTFTIWDGMKTCIDVSGRYMAEFKSVELR